MMAKLILVLIIGCLLPPVLPAQEAGDPAAAEDAVEVSIPRLLVLGLNFTGNLSDSEKMLLRESLLIRLTEKEDILVLEPVHTGVADLDQLNTRAVETGGDCWLHLAVQADEDNINITATSFDLYGKKYVFRDKVITRDRNIRSLTRSFWRSLVEDMDASYDANVEEKRVVVEYKTVIREEIIREERGVVLSVEAVPGTVITGLGEEAVIIDENGRLDRELLGYATYNLYARCAGYYPEKIKIYLADKDQTVQLKQMRASRWGVDVYLQNIDYIGIGSFVYIIPNRLFAELSATFYQKKLIWPVEYNNENYDLPLSHIFLTAGYYLNPEDSLIRYCVSGGVFLRLSHSEEVGLALDPLSWGGLKLAAIDAEVLTHMKVKLFAQYSILGYLTGDGHLMKAAIMEVNNSDNLLAGYLFFDKLVMDLLNFKIGCRVQIP